MVLKPVAGSSPHMHSGASTRRIMLDVIIALIPAAIAAVYFFGLNALLLIIVTVTACVVSEYIATKVMKKDTTVNDLSAVVTGMLLAFNLSPEVPLWVAAIGGGFAIIVVKVLFGGLGGNFVNPALAARAFLMASWPVQMTTWRIPGVSGLNGAGGSGSSSAVDALSSATPLELIKNAGGDISGLPSLIDMFVGNIGGCIGETSALALLIGATYLIARKVITLETPIAFIGTVAVMTWILGGGEGIFTGHFVYHVLAGGLVLGAFFMATDYTTSPMTTKGKLLFGAGCGLLTTVIRLYGGYPEGVSYSILLMNLTVPFIDRYMINKSFGSTKRIRGIKSFGGVKKNA